MIKDFEKHPTGPSWRFRTYHGLVSPWHGRGDWKRIVRRLALLEPEGNMRFSVVGRDTPTIKVYVNRQEGSADLRKILEFLVKGTHDYR